MMQASKLSNFTANRQIKPAKQTSKQTKQTKNIGKQATSKQAT
jgi:hypothetical protein